MRRARLAILLLLALVTCRAAGPTAPLRVAVLAENREAHESAKPFAEGLARLFGFTLVHVSDQPLPLGDSSSGFGELGRVDAAIVIHGPGALAAEDAAALRDFLRAGKALVLLGATPAAWPTESDFAQNLLGAKSGGAFAAGVPLTIINLFAHPIFSGIRRFETNQPVLLYTQLTDDAQMIMEGTVGEATAPLAWVRRRAAGRLAHFVFAQPHVLAEATYQRMIGQAVLWTTQRPIPGAVAAVQRTFMPDSYPGSIAITLPNGPGVCLDPVRGGINYIWDGDFVDLRPRWITKQGESPRLFGEMFYIEKEWQPFRAGSPTASPSFQFRGYTLRDGLPEFHYEIGGRTVHETLTAGRDPQSLLRRFRVGPGSTPLWLNLEPQGKAEVIVQGLERDGQLGNFSNRAGGEFTIEIRRKAVVAP